MHRRLLAAALVLAWLGLAAGFVLSVGDRGLDDVFITYRHAANLASGHGLVFTPGEGVLATTTPGLAVALAVLHRVTALPLAWLGTLLTAISLVSLGTILALDAARKQRQIEGIVLGTLLLACDFLWLHNGSEMLPALMLLALAGSIGHRGAAGLLAALATWCRPDLGLGIVVLAMLDRERRSLLRLGAGFALGILACATVTWWCSGAILPVTFGAKRAQAELVSATATAGLAFWPTAVASLAQLWSGIRTLPLLLLGALGAPFAWRHGGPTLRTVVGTGICHAVALPLLGVPFATWYPIPALVATLAGSVFLVGAVARRVPDRRLAVVVLLVGGSWWAVQAAHDLRVILEPRPYARLRLYEATAQWIRNRSAPADVIAAPEVGVIGATSRLAMLDLAGLTTPRVRPLLGSPTLGALVLGERPRWVVVHLGVTAFTDPVTQHPDFLQLYRERRWFGRPRSPERLVLYERRDG
jgi:hypothetical protein